MSNAAPATVPFAEIIDKDAKMCVQEMQQRHLDRPRHYIKGMLPSSELAATSLNVVQKNALLFAFSALGMDTKAITKVLCEKYGQFTGVGVRSDKRALLSFLHYTDLAAIIGDGLTVEDCITHLAPARA
ncbi:hypothetical protein THASP1DRAFT_33726 [Thamnocephalis sphaerospora]|uniref:Uncharacterized protein n=1 Tax=Thamnocephalis sphaerospora TaxID=78915 RepID=A0A4P9XGW9_9FUNG|nr:hypothetical protein THASP1DRAFT_33726 [Thamnocephalis sphaerospora]|eukprot:RKP04501.1 hypothetical protein THASP1DRAFT_33726 [Thamnocephalis sphaerospora]